MRVPGVSLYAQWPHLAVGRWNYRGSVLDGFRVASSEPREVRSLVVSVGTSTTFGFRRLLERLVAVVPTGVDVIWQTGATDVAGLPITARGTLRAVELADRDRVGRRHRRPRRSWDRTDRARRGEGADTRPPPGVDG